MEMRDKLPPWYRQFWPWFLMLFPAAAVVGGIITFRMAATSDDGVVADDYYKQGLAINRTLARDQVAAAAGLGAQMQVSGEGISLQLAGQLADWPSRLQLRILHPTRSGMDRTVQLASQGDGRYIGTFSAPATGKWELLLEDGAKDWRLVGTWNGVSPTVRLVPVQ